MAPCDHRSECEHKGSTSSSDHAQGIPSGVGAAVYRASGRCWVRGVRRAHRSPRQGRSDMSDPVASLSEWAVVGRDEASWARARDLARALSLTLLDARGSDWRGLECKGVVLVSEAGLALALTGRGGPSPVSVDFCSGALLHRLRGIGPRREDIGRAVGLPAPRPLHVVDATAGWGRDSAVLAALGCEVTMVERHPVVAALLEDGLARASTSTHPEVGRFLPRLRLVQADAAAWLDGCRDHAPDVVLLDPMFPEREGSAAVRKEMVMFHHLVGEDADAGRLLDAALSVARHRVVVKRPSFAPAIPGREVDFRIEGRSTRFDIYALRRIS